MEPNPFIQAKAHPSYSKGHHLQWKIDPAFYAPEPYNFTVELSETPSFNEILESIEVGNNFHYVDKSNTRRSLTINLFYRIKLNADGQIYYSQVFSSDSIDYDRRQYKLASEIARKEALRLSKFVGGAASLLKFRTYGKDAADNTVDPITGLALTATGPNYGNVKSGGYYDPVWIYFVIEGGEDHRRLAPDGTGVLEGTTADARALGFPLIETNDIIIEKEQDRCWIVKERQPVLFPGTSLIVAQTLKLSLIQPTDPVYSLDVPVHSYEPGI